MREWRTPLGHMPYIKEIHMPVVFEQSDFVVVFLLWV